VLGVHLAGLYLAGSGLAWLGRVVVAWVRRRFARRRFARPLPVAAAALVVAVLALAPAWTERAGWAAEGARWIGEQEAFDAAGGDDVAELVDIARRSGPGRIYAGMRSNWGSRYEVGQVPVYAVLLNLDVDAVGFTRPTWSLSSPAEFRFRDTDPAHYDVFDVRYLLQPAGREPPVEATLLAERGDHALWRIAVDGPVEVVATATPIAADRTNLGVRIAPWLSSDLPESGVHPGIAFGGFEAAGPTLPADTAPSGPAGDVIAVSVGLGEGSASATVDLRRPAAVILKASFDNRWRVTLDGRDVQAQMFAPSLVGRLVPPGRHELRFTYVPFPRYDLLLAIGAATFLVLHLAPSRLARRRARRPVEGSMAQPETQPVG